MANTLGTLATSVIIQRALELVFTKRPILNRISLDLSNAQCKFNQAIRARRFTVPTVNNFGTGVTDRADTDVPVTLDQFKEVHHAFTPQEYSGTSRNLREESASMIAVAIANAIVDAVAALWTAGNFANKTTVASGWTYANTVVAMRTALAARGVPDMDRFLCLNATVYGTLLGDQTMVAALYNPANGGAIASGVLPEVSGFGIMEYPGIPTAGNQIGFAGTKDSVVYAGRVPSDPREVLPNAPFPGNIGVVTEPKTGLSVMVNEWIDPATLKANVRLVWMYGVAVGAATNGQQLTTA